MWFNSFFIRLLTPGNLEPTTGTTTNTQHELSTSSASENGVTYAMSRLRVSTRKWRGVLRCRGCYAGRCSASTAVSHLIFEKKQKNTLSLHLSFQWPFSYFHFRITFRSRFFPHSFCRVNILPRPFHTLQYKAVFFVATSYRIVQAKMQYCLASIRTAPEVVL
jgi:hypothetical protein